MPVSKISKAKGKTKPSEYPGLILKALVREYDSNLDIRSNGMTESILAVKAGIVRDYEKPVANNKFTYGDFVSETNEALRILEDAKYITVSNYRADRLIKPTVKGIDHARWLMRPWYQKVWDYLKGDVRTVAIAIITAVITTLLTALILRLLNWT